MKRTSFIAAAIATVMLAAPAYAVGCSNNANGFNTFKKQFAAEAKAAGVGSRGMKALANAKYLPKVIKFDQRQARYFKKAGRSKTNINRHYQKSLKNMGGLQNVRSKMKRMSSFLNAIEKRYGVQKEVLVTIWGKETNFGGFTGNIDTINSLASLSHNCRRAGLFRPNLIAALKILDKGWIPRSKMRGAFHGELGQTQFMAANYLRYAKDGNGDGKRDLIRNSRDALASAANFLKSKGWRAGGSYQPGSANFRVLNSWNESTAYQHTIARIASQL
ncbi:lytic transglycosylase domain-containing protein [Pseudahrensia aquimaris]|uniref:Lytic transglycosylase domain-containing protein n=1 Tax=Pseudahrensia aquimaris TaxID=744461 RepID=A0ABW3FHB3_9HYPH